MTSPNRAVSGPRGTFNKSPTRRSPRPSRPSTTSAGRRRAMIGRGVRAVHAAGRHDPAGLVLAATLPFPLDLAEPCDRPGGTGSLGQSDTGREPQPPHPDGQHAAELGLAPEQVRATGGVEPDSRPAALQSLPGILGRRPRRIGPAPLGETYQGPGIADRVGRKCLEVRNPGPGVGQRQAGRNAPGLGRAAWRRHPQTPLDRRDRHERPAVKRRLFAAQAFRGEIRKPQ